MASEFKFGKGQYTRGYFKNKRNKVSLSPSLSETQFDLTLDMGLDNFDQDFAFDEEENSNVENGKFEQLVNDDDNDNSDQPFDLNEFDHVEFNNFLLAATLIQGEPHEEVKLTTPVLNCILITSVHIK